MALRAIIRRMLAWTRSLWPSPKVLRRAATHPSVTPNPHPTEECTPRKAEKVATPAPNIPDTALSAESSEGVPVGLQSGAPETEVENDNTDAPDNQDSPPHEALVDHLLNDDESAKTDEVIMMGRRRRLPIRPTTHPGNRSRLSHNLPKITKSLRMTMPMSAAHRRQI